MCVWARLRLLCLAVLGLLLGAACADDPVRPAIPTFTVIGVVQDANGAPMSGRTATVRARATSCEGSLLAFQTVQTDAVGEFRVGLPAPGATFVGCITIAIARSLQSPSLLTAQHPNLTVAAGDTLWIEATVE